MAPSNVCVSLKHVREIRDPLVISFHLVDLNVLLSLNDQDGAFVVGTQLAGSSDMAPIRKSCTSGRKRGFTAGCIVVVSTLRPPSRLSIALNAWA